MPVVIEASGVPDAVAAAGQVAARGGRDVMVGLPATAPPFDMVSMVVREVDVVATAAHVCDVDLPEALELLPTRALEATLVDRVIGLDRVVDDGIAAPWQGAARGKIIVDRALPRPVRAMSSSGPSGAALDLLCDAEAGRAPDHASHGFAAAVVGGSEWVLGGSPPPAARGRSPRGRA